MLLLTIGLTAAVIGAVVVGDHVLEIERPPVHMVFLYVAMFALLAAMAAASARGLLS
jgi:hypothetical protein